jgi:alpha,alpha-trehalose-phosphate synthase [UDP-forming]
VWTKDQLFDLVTSHFQNHKFIVVSNREPYIHVRRNGAVQCIRPASGMAAALDPILRASGGVWVAHGSGDADRITVNARNHVAVPPENPAYTLRRVWLSKRLEEEYYYGVSNEGLWPLCHVAFQRPTFSSAQWESYRKANRMFADSVLEEAAGRPAVVFIQDYHLALLPRMLKASNPNLLVAQFWHIPWPNYESFRVFPWKQELLEGMLGNDLLGFHLGQYCSNFLDTADRNVEALVDKEHSTIRREGHTTNVRAFPISIDFESHCRMAQSEKVEQEMTNWLQRLGPFGVLGIGIDRVDYTKGIPEKLRAVDLLLEQHREYVGKFTLAQVGVPSRTGIADYDQLNREVLQLVNDINAKWRRGDWQPIHFIHHHVEMPGLMALHRLADFCVVSSLHDGMNLVAKEFVSSRFDEDGVLILSSFAGASRELTSAISVNPFAPDEIAAAMKAAIEMEPEERTRRMRKMRRTVEENNIYRWAGKIVQHLLRVESDSDAVDAAERFSVGAA